MVDETTAFDMGISTLMRINYWLWRCNEAGAGDDVIDWFKSIKIVYKESDAFMNDKEREEHKEHLKTVEKSYSSFIKYMDNYKANPKQYHLFTPPREVFDQLFNWELLLRRILDRKGLLMRKGESAATAMDM